MHSSASSMPFSSNNEGFVLVILPVAASFPRPGLAFISGIDGGGVPRKLDPGSGAVARCQLSRTG